MRGSIALCNFCIAWPGFRVSCVISPPFPNSPLLPILPTIFSIRLYSSRSWVTSPCEEPEPLATRQRRVSFICMLQSNSSSVKLSIITMKRLIRFTPSFSAPFGIICAIPGIICITWLIGPIFCKFWNCSYRSRKENLPFEILFKSSGCLSRGIASVIVWKSPLRSPIPSNRDTKDCASKLWKSSKCSPKPRKIIGELVAATAESAPPPFAWPSNFVTMTLPTLTHSLKAFACSKHA
mmetsp:Transcript_14314/g.23391  ORF Transcript_14314/g.23391 Transcript_14314/m.23391 type:complete len:237 (-) Transcript_14314:287-997(-)